MLQQLFLVIPVLFMATVQAADVYVLVVHNSQSFARDKELVSIGRGQLGNHTTAFYPVISKHRQLYTCQPIDVNRDGIWDSLFIEVSLRPYATDTLLLEWRHQQPAAVPPLANVRFSLRSTDHLPRQEITDTFRNRGYVQDISKPVYQMEGPGIENDKVAFRVFFDCRNGKDIYGKLTTAPVLEKVGLAGSWHELQDWGMDILKTGQSMGAGAFAIREAGADYKLADADSTVFTNLYEGPLVAAFRLDFYNWDAGTKKQRGSEVITIQKGDYFYSTTLSLPVQEEQELLQGFAHFYRDSLVVLHHNKLYATIATYGKQAEGSATALGLAIMVPQKSFLSTGMQGDTGKLPNSCYVAMHPANSVRTLFFACWEKTDQRFANQPGFTNYLREVASRLAHPIRIKAIKKYN